MAQWSVQMYQVEILYETCIRAIKICNCRYIHKMQRVPGREWVKGTVIVLDSGKKRFTRNKYKMRHHCRVWINEGKRCILLLQYQRLTRVGDKVGLMVGANDGLSVGFYGGWRMQCSDTLFRVHVVMVKNNRESREQLTMVGANVGFNVGFNVGLSVGDCNFYHNCISQDEWDNHGHHVSRRCAFV